MAPPPTFQRIVTSGSLTEACAAPADSISPASSHGYQSSKPYVLPQLLKSSLDSIATDPGPAGFREESACPDNEPDEGSPFCDELVSPA